ncbi:hypothetical protein QBC45DRAFT_434768 [Copromyces sp. CBS 386.78]|nr:hypothetical protein QBC45DRAFT_434768 [Copromyces sp. CBS 386.78]
MDITRRIGYRYIWIDSLCIIQDSPEDWATEALTMKDVYGNTSCNIAALGGPADGCFVKRNPLHFFPCYIGRKDDRTYAFRSYNPIVGSRGDDNGGPPLLHRGWVVQEKLLSTRVIYMGIPQLHWECAQYTLSEGAPHMGEPVSSVPFYNQLVCAKSDFRILHGQPQQSVMTNSKYKVQNMIFFYKCWMRMVSDYSKMKFTNKEDSFIALAGIAEAIAVARGWTYVAGTWKEFWPFDLLWARYEPDPGPIDLRWREDRFKPVIPSWLTITYLAKVVDFSCPDFMTQHSLVGAKYGDIKLSLRGKVLRGWVNQLNTGTSGVHVLWDVKNPPHYRVLLLLLMMQWTECGEKQQAGLVLMKQMAPVSEVKQQMHFRVGAWEDYSPRSRHGRSLVFPDDVTEEVVHLC